MSERGYWRPAYIGLGSNLDSPIDQVKRAFVALSELPQTRLVGTSNMYRSAPLGPQDQPDFINAAASLVTQLDARKLLKELKKVEAAHGRDQTADRWGPRTIDLDLLLLGSCESDADGLILPHPGIAGRNFVLLPLLELAPHLHVPGLASVQRLTAALDGTEAGSARIEKLNHSNP